MSASIILIVAVVAFFVFLTAAMIGMSRAYNENMLGGLIVLWSVIIIFLLVIFFAGGNMKITEPAKADRVDIR